eukprot:s1171_g6.t9
MVLSAAATAREGQPFGQKLVTRYDVSVAFFDAASIGKIAVIPPEDVYDRHLWYLLKAMNGTREASKQWGELVETKITTAGFHPVKVVPGLFYHPEWQVSLSCHGHDFLAEGMSSDLDKLDELMITSFEAKLLPRIGPGQWGGQAQQENHLHRVIKWTGHGFTGEADAKPTKLHMMRPRRLGRYLLKYPSGQRLGELLRIMPLCRRGLVAHKKRQDTTPPAALTSIVSQRLAGLDHLSRGLRGWNDGEPWLFRLRASDYMKTRQKHRSGDATYRCIGVEVLQAPCQLYSCLKGLYPQTSTSSALPKVILVHFQLPLKPGPIYGSHPEDDPGCSVVLFFKLKEPVLDSPALGLLQRFLEADHPKTEGFAVSGCLKVVGFLENLDELDIPAAARPVVRKFNGKPVLIEKESRHLRFGDALEILVDVRGFNPLARQLLCRLRGQLPKSVMQLGILVQGVEDFELPEGFLGVARLDGLDLLNGRSVEIASPRSPKTGDDHKRLRQLPRPAEVGAVVVRRGHELWLLVSCAKCRSRSQTSRHGADLDEIQCHEDRLEIATLHMILELRSHARQSRPC